METNAGLILKLLVFVLDLFIIVFNFLAFRSYLPLKDNVKQRHVEVRNRAQQTYVAGDVDSKLLTDRKQNYQYKNSSSNLINKNAQSNCAYRSSDRVNANQLLESGGHFQKYASNSRERDYTRGDSKFNGRSPCHCEHCKTVKRPLSKL